MTYPIQLAGTLINILVPFISLFLIYYFQTWWSAFFLLSFYLGFIPIVDHLIGEQDQKPVEERGGKFFDGLLYLQAPFHFMAFVGIVVLVCTIDLPFWVSLVAVSSAGLINGQCILIAHEFAHRRGKLADHSAVATLSIVGMGHFMVEHVIGHHVHVATPEDCASARIGENIYRFALRDMPGEVTGGLSREAERLRKRGLSAYSLKHNRILQSYMLSALVAAIIAFYVGPQAFFWIAVHHVSAWFTLTLVTYIEHYGLLRAMKPNGKREAVLPLHSWNTDCVLSNALLINVQRHSDHHARPLVPYQGLKDAPQAPRLPTGYFGMIVLALIPPLWFRVMDDKVVSNMAGDLDRIHLAPKPSGRIKRLIADLTQHQQSREVA